MKVIDVGNDFSPRLSNRNKFQGDGKKTAIEFRDKYLQSLDSKEKWETDAQEITFDFASVKVLGPSFANEAFSYFTKYATPDRILKKIGFANLSQVKYETIEQELQSGYKR